MNITGLDAISKINGISGSILDKTTEAKGERTASFEGLLQSAITMINETNNYTNKAEEAEIAYALGLNTNTSDLMVAQQKANVSLQYTVAVRNAVLDAYREIMQLQF